MISAPSHRYHVPTLTRLALLHIVLLTPLRVFGDGGTRALLLVGMEVENPVWQDMAYLAAVPAVSHRSGRAPAVIATDPSGALGREVGDYVARYRPQQVFALGMNGDVAAPEGLGWTVLKASAASEASLRLAGEFWGTCDQAVVCRDDDYASALLASSLASLLDCPLLLAPRKDGQAATRTSLKALGVKQLIAVGFVPGPAPGNGPETVVLKDAVDVMRHLKTTGAACDYIAIANPFDRSGTARKKLSLVAPLLCAARRGLVIPVDCESQWMASQEATLTEKRPAGLPEGAEAAHTGTVTFCSQPVGFAIAMAPGSRRDPSSRKPSKQVFLDLNGDGDYFGEGEGPFWSTDTVKQGNQSYSLVPSGPTRRRKKAPVALKVCTPTAKEIRGRLEEVWRAAGRVAANLCIVGHSDAIPFWLCLDGPDSETFVESDVPYADADDDPFYELNVGRIIAENAHFATLHASRTVTYDHLLDPRWIHSVGFARWEDSLGPQFANVGFHTQYLHTKHDRPEVVEDKPLAPGARRGKVKRAGTCHAHSPLANVAAIVHGSHSWYMGLGETYTVEADVLLSPCVVESSGCGPTALHIDKDYISVVSRLFRNGAVAFHGNAVPSPAPHQELRYGFWVSVLGGATLGAAHRDALNRKMLTVLENDQLERGGVDRRTMIMRHLYGDPAFKMFIPDTRRFAPVQLETDGDRLTVNGPERWYVAQIRVPEDWKRWADKPLYVLRAPGVYIRAQWCREEYDLEEVYADVAFTTRHNVAAIRQVTELAAPLGWRDKYFVDENANGTRTYRWRIRMADFDQIEGTIRSRVERIQYQVESPLQSQ
jgi:hypothetical protein